MKYLIGLLLGVLVGAALFVIALIYNPFISAQSVSPLSVTNADTLVLSYSEAAADSIVFSNNGESRIGPHPAKVLQLWESSVRQTSAMVTVLRDARNQTVGIGFKISSLSEDTHLLSGKVLLDSLWYLHLPGRGSLFFEQRENRWSYLRDVAVPAYRSPTNRWKGSWHGTITDGPLALGMASVAGGWGEFVGDEMLGVESLSVQAWSVDDGPISSTGSIIIELPETAGTAVDEDETR